MNTVDEDGNKKSVLTFCDMSLETVNDVYKIEKIEKVDIGKVIFSGNIADGENIVLGSATMANELAVGHNGSYYSLMLVGARYEVMDLSSYRLLGEIETDDEGILKFYALEDLENVTIYSVCSNADMVVENGYVANYKDDKWMLIDWPSTNNIIPQTVAGKTINGIVTSNKEPLYYDRELDVEMAIDTNEFAFIYIEVAAGVNPQKIFDAIEYTSDNGGVIYKMELDLSALDDIDIPQNVLDVCDMAIGVIYVSEDVKQKYPYDFVIVK